MNFSLSFVPKVSVLVLAAILIGCNRGDGSKEVSRGFEAYDLRDLKKAESLFEKALKLSPENSTARLALARVKLDLGDLQRAKTLIDPMLADEPKAADLRLLAGQLAWHRQEYDNAADIFKGLSNDTLLPAEIQAQGWAGLGVVEMSRNNRDFARIAFLRAIRTDRRNAAAWYHLGMLYRDAYGYHEAALEQFEVYVRLEVAASPRVQKVQRDVIPALKDIITRLASQRPGVAKRNSAACSTAIAKGEAALKKGQVAVALASYESALKFDPLSYPAAMGVAKCWSRTPPSLKKGGVSNPLKKAFEGYKLACTLRPGSTSTYLTTGALASLLGYHAAAVEIYSRAVAASPTSFAALDALIRALRKVGGKADIAQRYQNYRDSIPRKK